MGEKICFQGTDQYQFWPYENLTQITEGKIILLFKDFMFVRHLFDIIKVMSAISSIEMS